MSAPKNRTVTPRRRRWLVGSTAALAVLAGAILLRPGGEAPGSRPERPVRPAPSSARPPAGGGDDRRTRGTRSPSSRRPWTLAARLPEVPEDSPGAADQEAPGTAAESAPAVVIRVVRAADGRAVADAPVRVALRGDEGSSLRQARTDDDGRIALAAIEPGLYGMQLDHARYLGHSGALEVPAVERQPLEVEVSLTAGHSVEGRVVGRDGVPVSGARVILSRARAAPPARVQALTGADGRFRVRRLREGAWAVTALKSSFRAAGPVPVRVPGASSVELRLEKSRPIVVHTRSPDGPLSGTVVRARIEGLPAAALPLRSVTSNDLGNAVLSGLPADGTVEIALTGYRSGFAAVRRKATVAELESGVILEFRRPGQVAGVVADSGGRPVANASVHLEGPVEKTVRTTSSGQFLFRALPPGRYVLGASTPREGSSAAVPLELAGADDIRERLVLERGPGRIEGRVVGSGGRPLELVPVVVETTATRLTTVSDAGGRFLFDGIADGEYRIRAGDPRRGSVVRSGVAVAGDALVLSLEPPGSISGVVDVRGPSDGFAIRLERSESPASKPEVLRTWRFASHDPYFRLDSVPPGSYRIVVLGEGDGRRAVDEVDVRPGERTGPLRIE